MATRISRQSEFQHSDVTNFPSNNSEGVHVHCVRNNDISTVANFLINSKGAQCVRHNDQSQLLQVPSLLGYIPCVTCQEHISF